MYIVIVGGGKVGYYLCKTLLPNKHRVAVVERNKEMCERIANELNIPVINGDGTNIDDLTDIHVEKADVFIAVTGRDEDNLIACQLAKRNFGVKRTIARVNNPKNITAFERLGVDIPVSSTSIIADLIEQEVDFAGIKTLTMLQNGKIVFIEIFLNEASPVCGKSLREINLPRKCILVSVVRNEEVIIPNGFTVLQPGDLILAVSSAQDRQELKGFFLGE